VDPGDWSLGPDDPELPDTGPRELLALLAGGLGLTFIGSGSLVIAGDRRRMR
jgi:LPXTG-motif cell wall-anchored protein